MRVLARRKALAGGAACDICEHEPGGVAEDLVYDPGNVILRAMLEHVGRDDAVKRPCRQSAERRVARVVALDVLHAPELEYAGPFDPGVVLHYGQLVGHALAAAVVEQRARPRPPHQFLDPSPPPPQAPTPQDPS